LAVGISIIAVVLLILSSLVTVVGYQTVQSSFQVVKNNDDSRERIFHAIRVLANNHEVQMALFEQKMKQKHIPMRDSPFVVPSPITDQDLTVAYQVGVLLIKILGETRMQSVLNNIVMMDNMNKGFSEAVNQNASLRAEVSELFALRSTCDCDESLRIFPPICLCIVLCILSVSNAFLYELSYGLSLLFSDLYHTTYFYVFLVCLFLSRIFSRLASVFDEISQTAYYLMITLECIDPYPWSMEDR
jgi:hypothetical protein